MVLSWRRVAPALAALLACGTAAARSSSPPPDRRAAVDALFAAFDRTDLPGCSLGVFQEGRVAYARGYGMANLELHVANSPQTVFDIGSLGKQFTAFAILLLARDGKLSIDDDIRKYVTEIPDFGRRVTIRNLLNHTGGLRDYIGLLELEGLRTEDVATEQEALDALARQKAPLFPPGARYEYSNSGYFLLSIVVKRAIGKSLRDFAQERIFGPLGMTHTQYNEDHTRIIPDRSTGYTQRDGGGFQIDMSDFEQNGDGGVLTSVEDLFLWDRNFADPIVGDRELLDEMQTPGRLADGKPIDYSMGLRVGEYRGLKTVGHTGSWAGYRAILERFPDQKFSVAILCNHPVDRVPMMRGVAALYLGNLMGPEAKKPEAAAAKAEPIPADRIARLAGTYRDRKNGEIWFLSADGGNLVLENGTRKVPLASAGADVLAPREGGSLRVKVLPRPGGRSALEATWSGEDAQTFEPVETWSPTPAQLASFAGAYVSDEVGGMLRFSVADGALHLKHRVYGDEPWRAAGKDTMTGSGLAVTFTRDRSGRVTGLMLDTGGMTAIAYRKVGS